MQYFDMSLEISGEVEFRCYYPASYEFDKSFLFFFFKNKFFLLTEAVTRTEYPAHIF